MSTLGTLLTIVGAFAFLSLSVSIVIATQTFKNRMIANDEVLVYRFYQEVVLIFLSLFFLLIPFLAGQVVDWIPERKRRRKMLFNIGVMKCSMQLSVGAWTLPKKIEIRWWFEAESILRNNRWGTK